MIIRTICPKQLWSNLRFFSKHYSTHGGFEFSKVFPETLKGEFESSFIVYENFVSLKEEDSLMAEFEPHLKRHLYEKDHWDNVSTCHCTAAETSNIFFVGGGGGWNVLPLGV